jgi:hypothetical protein
MTSILLLTALDKMEPVWVQPGQYGADARAEALTYIQHRNGRSTPGIIQEIMRVVGIAEHAAVSLIRLFDDEQEVMRVTQSEVKYIHQLPFYYKVRTWYEKRLHATDSSGHAIRSVLFGRECKTGFKYGMADDYGEFPAMVALYVLHNGKAALQEARHFIDWSADFIADILIAGFERTNDFFRRVSAPALRLIHQLKDTFCHRVPRFLFSLIRLDDKTGSTSFLQRAADRLSAQKRDAVKLRIISSEDAEEEWDGGDDIEPPEFSFDGTSTRMADAEVGQGHNRNNKKQPMTDPEWASTVYHATRNTYMTKARASTDPVGPDCRMAEVLLIFDIEHLVRAGLKHDHISDYIALCWEWAVGRHAHARSPAKAAAAKLRTEAATMAPRTPGAEGNQDIAVQTLKEWVTVTDIRMRPAEAVVRVPESVPIPTNKGIPKQWVTDGAFEYFESCIKREFDSGGGTRRYLPIRRDGEDVTLICQRRRHNRPLSTAYEDWMEPDKPTLMAEDILPLSPAPDDLESNDIGRVDAGQLAKVLGVSPGVVRRARQPYGPKDNAGRRTATDAIRAIADSVANMPEDQRKEAQQAVFALMRDVQKSRDHRAA